MLPRLTLMSMLASVRNSVEWSPVTPCFRKAGSVLILAARFLCVSDARIVVDREKLAKQFKITPTGFRHVGITS
jgi:hypothetical protein